MNDHAASSCRAAEELVWKCLASQLGDMVVVPFLPKPGEAYFFKYKSKLVFCLHLSIEISFVTCHDNFA